MRPHLVARCRDQRGFGLIELLIAMNVMVVGVLALFVMFQSGILQIRRASTVSTAAALAEAEMENYRAIKYDTIVLEQADIDALPADDPYKTDAAYIAGSLITCATTDCTTNVPTKNAPGADGRQYRLDTFMSWQTVTNGRDVKLVSIVVRDASDTTKVWARVVSSFDQSTGL